MDDPVHGDRISEPASRLPRPLGSHPSDLLVRGEPVPIAAIHRYRRDQQESPASQAIGHPQQRRHGRPPHLTQVPPLEEPHAGDRNHPRCPHHPPVMLTPARSKAT